VSVARGPRPARPRGRHLLRSSRFADAIVRDAGVAPGDLVVDIGAGSGMLTRALDRAGAAVIALEPDVELAARLRRACPRARVMEAEAHARHWPQRPFRVVANLPFARTTEILRALLSDPAVPVRSVDAVVQWELAVKRTRVWPSTFLSALWSAWFELDLVRRLPPAAFVPPPPVAAAVLRATRRAEALVAAEEARRYAAFLGCAYGGGTLRRALRGFTRMSADFGLDPDATARDVAPRDWPGLFHSVRRPR
jgi:23S rRNA (adenine-N6)-dimethyltransferase